ncbi:MAG: hypothetical protein GWO20_01250 [Candidatus Korarchaeota archaeon]|nr:hypothetical protein [Candidatus Korarchaeota archaeon]NIU83071.1 hypothetical protein [Candidatus Thorarchaeota archaeon]NIW12615.1 hypothetical protein [Candidatus Thorarchaeota archaeon]NIW50826.1 hypothetical protein [Candidatus Korarchaeota archaeon]
MLGIPSMRISGALSIELEELDLKNDPPRYGDETKIVHRRNISFSNETKVKCPTCGGMVVMLDGGGLGLLVF